MDFQMVLGGIKLPTWALCPLFNCDYSALESGDEKQIDGFDQDMRENFGAYIIDIVEEEADFEPFPEFGLACDCVTVNIWSAGQ